MFDTVAVKGVFTAIVDGIRTCGGAVAAIAGLANVAVPRTKATAETKGKSAFLMRRMCNISLLIGMEYC
jgi:hypothetical protein